MCGGPLLHQQQNAICYALPSSHILTMITICLLPTATPSLVCSVFGQEVEGRSLNVTGLKARSKYAWDVRSRNPLGDSTPVSGLLTTGDDQLQCNGGMVPGPVRDLTASFTPPRGEQELQCSHACSL